MKKSFKMLATAIAAISLLWACGDANNADSYTVDVNITGLADSTKLIITPVTHIRDAENLGEAYIVDGKAQFNGAVEIPSGAYLKIENSSGWLPFVLENGKTTISGEISGEKSQRDSTIMIYDFSNIKVEGSENTPRFQHFFHVRDSLFNVSAANREKFADIRQKHAEAYQAKDKKRIAEIEATDEYKAYYKSEEDFHNVLEDTYHGLINEGKDSYWGPMTMLALYWYFIPDMRPLYEGFSDEAKASSYGQEVKKELYPVGYPGDKLENFSQVDADGNALTMEEFVSTNKYTLIDFWASWCGPCRREIPNLRKLYEKYRDSGFNVLSVSIDQEDEDWRKALNDEKLPWINCRDTDGSIAKAYSVKSIPMLVVVDNEGKLVVENLRGEELENKIAELLNKCKSNKTID